MPYLLKSEPDKYSYDDLLRDGETEWDGIKNQQALNYLAAMPKGEKLVIYHSNIGKEVVGTATIASVDITDKKNPIARVKAGKRLSAPRPPSALREASVFKGSIMFTQFRLSVVPITEDQYDWLIHG
jgi:predicted RNA-binding protein with PUA-like domain